MKQLGRQMVDAAPIRADVRAFLERSGMPPTTFGRVVMGDGRFVENLKVRDRVTSVTAERVRSFITRSGGQVGDAPRRVILESGWRLSEPSLEQHHVLMAEGSRKLLKAIKAMRAAR